MGNYVSLLPQEYRQKLADELKLKRILLLCIIVAVILAFSLLGSFAINTLIASDIAKTEKDIDAVNTQITSYSDFEAMQQDMETLRNKISTVKLLDPQWLPEVYAFTNSLPDGVWVQSMTCTSSGGTARIIAIDCGGAKYSDVSAVIAALEQIPSVVSAVCISSNLTSAQDNIPSSLKFTLHITLKDIGIAALETEAAN